MVCLHVREDEVVVVEGAADVCELHGRLDHATRAVAVEGEDARRERAVVGADAHAAVEVAADLDERREGLGDVLTVAQEVLVGLVRQVVLLGVGARIGRWAQG